MSKVMKKSVLKAIATIGRKSAEIGCSSASVFGYHQPKEPISLKEKLNVNKKK